MRMESKGLIGSCLCMLVAGGGCVRGEGFVDFGTVRQLVGGTCMEV